MPDRPSVFIQETPYSCAPACLLMVLSSLGVQKSEGELRVLCDCSVVPGSEGTLALSVVDAARGLGFTNSRKYTMDLDGLRAELSRGVFPIVYIHTPLKLGQPSQQHAVVVVEVNETTVEVNDPWCGEYTFSIQEFVEVWQRMNGLTIIIE
jgi:predicted double-glycine peptidase